MRILYIITGADIGGAQRHVLYLAQWFQQKGHDVHVVTGEEGPFLTALQENNIPFHVIPIPRAIRPLEDIKALWKLYWWIRRHPFDIVHCHSSKAGIVGRIAAYWNGVRKIIFTAHGFVFTDPTLSKWKKRFYLLLEKLGELVSTDVITVSEFDYCQAKKYGLNSKKIHIVHNGIPDSHILLEEEWRNKQKVRQRSKKIVGFVGRFVSEKNLDMLIRVAERCQKNKFNDVEFWLIGDGVLRSKYEQDVMRKQLHHIVRFYGNQDNVLDWMDQMHVLLITSHKEGLPYVLLEALGRGVPVISTDVGGIKEVLGEENIVAINDDRSMFEKMIKALDEHECQKQGRKALQIARHFSVQAMGQKTEEVYMKKIL